MNWLFIYLLILNAYTSFSYTVDVQDTGYKTYEGYKHFKIENGDHVNDLLRQMKMLDYSLVYEESRESLQILIAPELLDNFMDIVNKLNLNTELISDDFSRIIQNERATLSDRLKNNKGMTWDAYYDVDDIYAYLKKVSESYPEWAQVVQGGETYEGRQILGLKIDTKQKGYNDTKLKIFIESGIHAREWITPATTTYFINQLFTSKDEDIIRMRDQFEWHIFPIFNPDGYHYTFTTDRMWRKTRSKSSKDCYGADPNRNWDYKWMTVGASSDPCEYQTYAGSSAFSEIETRTLSNYISKLDNLLAYIGFHSDAQMLLVPYSDSKAHVENFDDLYKIGKVSLQYGEKVNGAIYKGPGTAAELLGPVAGVSMCWVRETKKTPLAFIFELRGRLFVWPPERIPEQGEEYTQMMLGLLIEAKNLGYYK